VEVVVLLNGWTQGREPSQGCKPGWGLGMELFIASLLTGEISEHAHALIDSRGGIWMTSVVRRRARLPINQGNETNGSISGSRYRSTYFNPNISNNRHNSTKTIKKNKLCES
jgi:hypothetical protein